MSFNQMKKPELLKVVEEFAVDVQPSAKPAEIRAAIVEEGVTWDMWLASQGVEPEPENVVTTEVVEGVTPTANLNGGLTTEPIVEKQPEQILVRMTRENRSYQFGPYKFTHDHPFVAMPVADAEVLFKQEGFRQAFPSEAAEYYS